MIGVVGWTGLVGVALGAELHVPGDYPDPQAAVNAAANGDRIVLDTRQVGDLAITGKAVTLAGVGWVGELVATGGAAVTVDGMTLGGTLSTDPADLAAGRWCVDTAPTAISATDAAVTLVGATLQCFDAGAVLATDTDLVVDGSTFVADGPSGALVQHGGTLVVTDSWFERGEGIEGAAISADGSSATVTGSTFLANTASLGDGGAVRLAFDAVELTDNHFDGNVALEWWIPGVVVTDPADLLGLDGTLVIAAGNGGAVAIEAPSSGVEPSVLVGNNLFCHNQADKGGGLGVAVAGAPVLRNNRFSNNLALHEGGGAAFDVGSPEIDNNTLLVNEAGVLPLPYPQLSTTIGGGAIAAFGPGAVLRNNVLAYTAVGGGVRGPAELDLQYDQLYWNCGALGCSADPLEWENLTGDASGLALSATNLLEDPFPGLAPSDDVPCVDESFWPAWGSPEVRSGDPALPNVFSAPLSDRGAYGGPYADVRDDDLDGYENIYDCDDADAAVHPEAVETCDGVDQNCDGLADDPFQVWPDADGDGFGDATATPVVECLASGATNGADCDDGDAAIHPGADEVCDGVDQDCDAAADEDAIDQIPSWADPDGDGFGDGVSALACAGATGLAPADGDCAADDPTIHPGAVEVCDRLDQDCDGLADEDPVDAPYWPVDHDLDGFAGAETLQACEPPADAADLLGDCDDADPAVAPGAIERCDGVDQDCNSAIDDLPVDGAVWFTDADGDGFGDPALSRYGCVDVGSVDNGLDCDDADPTLHPSDGAGPDTCAAKAEGGCGCSSASTPASALWSAPLALLAVRRRRHPRVGFARPKDPNGGR